jgi:glycogen phosphorylase
VTYRRGNRKMMLFKKYHIAYFSMEIGIDPEIPTYSGGLGVLAGDTLRSCADLGIPVVGVTLLYKKGFFHQTLDGDGNQHEAEVEWKPEDHLKPLSQEVWVRMHGRDVKVTGWIYELKGIQGSRNAILFLDTDHPENSDYDKMLTSKLYAGDSYFRQSQEVILGIGGVRMLEALGCSELKKYHMNEGHSALLTVELYNQFKDSDDSIQEVRDRCVFTTHTPVPAGHDAFPQDVTEQIIGEMLTDELRKEIYVDGKLSMTHLALRFSEYINGVAKKHGEVSRQMFPGYHIDSITNGVHSAFWTTESYKRLFDKYIPGWRQDSFSLRYVLSIPEEEIWEAHIEAKQRLTEYIKEKYDQDFDPECFTIGFARRAATYKRGDMLFNDINRLRKIAMNSSKGIQIIYAGKAHPNDWEGKQVIKRIIAKMHEVSDKIKVIYLRNYNIKVAKLLIPGVDIWLNTPQRPKEASGTSGMKAAHNGVPHFSTLDGWWIEGHIEKVTGFSIGEHPKNAPDPSYEKELEDLYSKLEYVIVPRYYNERDKWINMMKHSIAMNGSFFNTHRMVQQYVMNAYFK